MTKKLGNYERAYPMIWNQYLFLASARERQEHRFEALILIASVLIFIFFSLGLHTVSVYNYVALGSYILVFLIALYDIMPRKFMVPWVEKKDFDKKIKDPNEIAKQLVEEVYEYIGGVRKFVDYRQKHLKWIITLILFGSLVPFITTFALNYGPLYALLIGLCGAVVILFFYTKFGSKLTVKQKRSPMVGKRIKKIRNSRAFIWFIPMFAATAAAIFYPETLWLASIVFLISLIFLFRSFVINLNTMGRLGRAIAWGLMSSLLIIAGLLAVMFSSQAPEYLDKVGIPEDKAVPWVEEGAKFACAGGVVLGLVSLKRKDIFWVLLLGGLIVGLAFGFMETMTSEKYLANFPLRLGTSIPSHAFWTALATAGLWFPLVKYRKYKFAGFGPVIFVYSLAAMWHHAWNTGAFFEVMKWVPAPAVATLFFLTTIKYFRYQRPTTKRRWTDKLL